jgi:hypothetical protein
LPIKALCDCVPARASIQALGLLFRMATTEFFCDTSTHKVFCRMVQPYVNVRHVDMSSMTDTQGLASLTYALMMDATMASVTIPNLDAKFSFLPYKFSYDVPAPDKAQLFPCMSFEFDGTYRRNIPLPFYAG